MNLLEVLLLSLVASVGLVQCQPANSLAKYVRETAEADFDGSSLDWIAELVDEQTDVTQPKQIGQYLEELLEKVDDGKELPSPFKGDLDDLKASLRYLVYLYKPQSQWYVFCTERHVNNFIIAFKRLFGNLELLASLKKDPLPTNKHPELFKFLRHYGGIMFSDAARRLDDVDLGNLKQKMGMDNWKALEGLAATQDKYKRATEEVLKSIDFVEGDFDAIKMGNVLGFGWTIKRMDGRKADALIEFIDDKCDRFLKNFKGAINLINMNLIISQNEVLYYILNKYSEYARICYQFKDPDTSQTARDNIRKKLPQPVSRLGSFKGF